MLLIWRFTVAVLLAECQLPGYICLLTGNSQTPAAVDVEVIPASLSANSTCTNRDPGGGVGPLASSPHAPRGRGARRIAEFFRWLAYCLPWSPDAPNSLKLRAMR